MNDFYLVHRSLLPEDVDNIIECRNLVETKHVNIVEACKICNISRTKYYKYKDLIFLPTNVDTHMSLISLNLSDEKGILSSVLGVISSFNCNVIKINQETILNGMASINIAIDTKEMKSNIEDLLDDLRKLKGVNLVKLVII